MFMVRSPYVARPQAGAARVPVPLLPRSSLRLCTFLVYNRTMEHELLTVQNVKDLQAHGKRWLEDVLGGHLKENQQVFIMVFNPDVEPDEATRRQALAK